MRAWQWLRLGRWCLADGGRPGREGGRDPPVFSSLLSSSSWSWTFASLSGQGGWALPLDLNSLYSFYMICKELVGKVDLWIIENVEKERIEWSSFFVTMIMIKIIKISIIMITSGWEWLLENIESERGGRSRKLQTRPVTHPIPEQSLVSYQWSNVIFWSDFDQLHITSLSNVI